MPKGTNPNSLIALEKGRALRIEQETKERQGREEIAVRKYLVEALNEKLKKTKAGRDTIEALGLKENATWGRAIAVGLCKRATGSSDAAREIRETIEGKALTRLRFEESDGPGVSIQDQTEDELRRDIFALLIRSRSRRSESGGAGGGSGQTSAA